MAYSKGNDALQKYEKVAQLLKLVRLPISTCIRPQLLGPKHARRAKSRGSCVADRRLKLSSRLWLWCWLFKLKAYNILMTFMTLVCSCLFYCCGTPVRYVLLLFGNCLWADMWAFRVSKRLFTVLRRCQPQWHLQEQRDFCWSQSLPICDLPSPPVSNLPSLTHFVAQPKVKRQQIYNITQHSQTFTTFHNSWFSLGLLQAFAATEIAEVPWGRRVFSWVAKR